MRLCIFPRLRDSRTCKKFRCYREKITGHSQDKSVPTFTISNVSREGPYTPDGSELITKMEELVFREMGRKSIDVHIWDLHAVEIPVANQT